MTLMLLGSQDYLFIEQQLCHCIYVDKLSSLFSYPQTLLLTKETVFKK